MAAILVTVGNAGGVGGTVAGVARVPFVVGIDRYLPAVFGRIHPKWKTPWVAILVQAGLRREPCCCWDKSTIRRIRRTRILVDAGTILYFIPFMYMYAAVIRLAYRADRGDEREPVLIPGGKLGVWTDGDIGIFGGAGRDCVVVDSAGGSGEQVGVRGEAAGGSVFAILFGLMLYYRGARAKAREAARTS